MAGASNDHADPPLRTRPIERDTTMNIVTSHLAASDVGLYIVKSTTNPGLYRAGIAGTRVGGTLLSRMKHHASKPRPDNATTQARPWECIWVHAIPNASRLQLEIAEHILFVSLIPVGEFQHNSIFRAADDATVCAAAEVARADILKVRVSAATSHARDA